MVICSTCCSEVNDFFAITFPFLAELSLTFSNARMTRFILLQLSEKRLPMLYVIEITALVAVQ